jgi:hypothetical protein
MVISAGAQKLAVVTLDNLKYPAVVADEARRHVEAVADLPAGHIVLCASHTHSGPLFSYYEDRLIETIGEAVNIAVGDLSPCKIGVAKGSVEGVTHNRRLLLNNGDCWNSWLVVPPAAKQSYPAAGPIDPELGVLAVEGRDGRYKAILYNYASHPDGTRGALISADFPGHVQRHVQQQLGYEVMTLFALGSCGDINTSDDSAAVGKAIADEIIQSLGKITYISDPTVSVIRRDSELPARDAASFPAEEIARKWPGALEHYRSAFKYMKQREKERYRAVFNGIRIGNEFALITNPVELFAELGMAIKRDSPFQYTMVATLTNGALGYVPTAAAFEEGGYETWFGEHSFLGVETGDMIKRESLDILRQLHNTQ